MLSRSVLLAYYLMVISTPRGSTSLPFLSLFLLVDNPEMNIKDKACWIPREIIYLQWITGGQRHSLSWKMLKIKLACMIGEKKKPLQALLRWHWGMIVFFSFFRPFFLFFLFIWLNVHFFSRSLEEMMYPAIPEAINMHITEMKDRLRFRLKVVNEIKQNPSGSYKQTG